MGREQYGKAEEARIAKACGKREKSGRRKEGANMTGVLHVAAVLAAIVAGLFALTFLVYFWNLDMKLTARLAPLFEKHYDKIDRDKHL